MFAEFLAQSAPNNEFAGFFGAGQPIKKELSGLGFIVPEDLSTDVSIDDRAHLEANRTANFIHEELPVPRRRIQNVPHLIQSQGMNVYVHVTPFKVED